MIYTVTLNPAVDVYFTISKPLQEIEVNRADSQTLKAAGKGINCSLLLDTLSIPSTAVALLGGFSGAFIKAQLQEKKLINVVEIAMKAENRINMKLLQKYTSLSVNASCSPIDETVKKELFACTEMLTADDIVLLSGSLIPGFSEADYIELCRSIKAKQSFLAVDTEMLSLSLLKKIQPDLIKPNLYELSLLLKRDSLSESLYDGLQEVLKYTRSVLLSLGADGAVFCNHEITLRITQQPIQAKNTVGCGDALLAGFIGEYAKTNSLFAALAMGAACACAHAEGNDTALDLIKSYLPKITITLIESLTDLQL